MIVHIHSEHCTLEVTAGHIWLNFKVKYKEKKQVCPTRPVFTSYVAWSGTSLIYPQKRAPTTKSVTGSSDKFGFFLQIERGAEEPLLRSLAWIGNPLGEVKAGSDMHEHN